MLCLTEIIRPYDPSMQRLCRAIEDAWARPELIVAAWKLARVLAVDIVEYVLWGAVYLYGHTWGPVPYGGRGLCHPSGMAAALTSPFFQVVSPPDRRCARRSPWVCSKTMLRLVLPLAGRRSMRSERGLLQGGSSTPHPWRPGAGTTRGGW
jgi:hypothetical protein